MPGHEGLIPIVIFRETFMTSKKDSYTDLKERLYRYHVIILYGIIQTYTDFTCDLQRISVATKLLACDVSKSLVYVHVHSVI